MNAAWSFLTSLVAWFLDTTTKQRINDIVAALIRLDIDGLAKFLKKDLEYS